MRTFCRPAHRLMFAHSFVHEVIHFRFRGRARYPEPMTVGMSVICQAASVAHQIVAQLQEMISKALQSFRVCRAIVVGDGIDNAANAHKDIAHSSDLIGPSTIPYLVAYAWELF